MYLNVDYTDFDEYIHGMDGWEIDVRKLDKGDFIGNLSLIDCQLVQIVRISFNGSMDRYGLSPQGYTSFVIPSFSQQDYHWFNRDINQSVIAKFPESRDLDMFSKGYFQSIGLNIKTTHLKQLIEHYKFTHTDKLLNNKEQTFQFSHYTTRHLANYILKLFASLEKTPQRVMTPEFNYSVNYHLPYILLELLEKSEHAQTKRKYSKREILLQNTVDFVNNNIHKKISLRELEQHSKVSKRKLEYDFKQHFGLSPISYINRSKLSLIKKELSKPYQEKSIAEIIKGYSIKHQGQFSKDYHLMFDELPSETRKRQF